VITAIDIAQQPKEKFIDPREVETDKAFQRIGNLPEDWMRWMLRIAQYDLNKLSEGDWSNLSYEFIALRWFPHGRKGNIPRIVIMVGGIFSTPTRTQVIKFHKDLNLVLDCILKKKIILFEPKLIRIEFDPPENKRAQWHIGFRADKWEDALEYVAAQWFSIYIDKIKQCPRCNKIHLADRKNQEYCSRRCQTQAATQTYRERKGLISGRPRGRPRKEVSLKGKKKGVKHAKRK